jgi:hypothetical protein
VKGSIRHRATILALAVIGCTLTFGVNSALAVSSTPDLTDMVNGKVFAMVRSGNTMYIGGQFTRVLHSNGTVAYAATNLAAIDLTTGQGIPTFAPPVTSSTTTAVVRSLAVSSDGSALYVGGAFDSLGGQPVMNLGRINLTTGLADATFHPQVTGGIDFTIVYGMLLSPTRLYFGGDFMSVDGKVKKRVAAVDLTGTLDPNWKASAGSKVRTLAFSSDGNTIFLGGRFTVVDNVSRQSIARVSTTTGALDPWAVPAGVIETPQQCFSFQVTTTTLYVGCGAHPNWAAAFRLDNGTVGSRIWRFDTVGNVEAVQLNALGNELFIGGHFGTGRLQQQVCGGVSLHGLALLVAATGTVDCSWIPQEAPFGSNYQGTWQFLMTDSNLWIGGGFTTVNGVSHRGMARFALLP